MKAGDLVKVCKRVNSTGTELSVLNSIHSVVSLEMGEVGLLIRIEDNSWSSLSHQVYFQSLNDYWWFSKEEVVKLNYSS